MKFTVIQIISKCEQGGGSQKYEILVDIII